MHMEMVNIIYSIIIACGISIIMVEKADTWPVRNISITLKWIIHKYFSRKFAKVMDCTTCMSFWTAVIADLFLMWATGGKYFCWPMSGFAASGTMWTLMNLINAIDSPKKIYFYRK